MAQSACTSLQGRSSGPGNGTGLGEASRGRRRGRHTWWTAPSSPAGPPQPAPSPGGRPLLDWHRPATAGCHLAGGRGHWAPHQPGLRFALRSVKGAGVRQGWHRPQRSPSSGPQPEVPPPWCLCVTPAAPLPPSGSSLLPGPALASTGRPATSCSRPHHRPWTLGGSGHLAHTHPVPLQG